MPDSDSELGDLRTDGTHARALTSHIGASGGFLPFYKEPPRYIRVRSYNKKTKDFNHLFLAQVLGTHSPADEDLSPRAPQTAVGKKLLKAGDAIWAAEFSLDGRYLAVAGRDQVVRVFAVISTPDERQAHEEDESHIGDVGERLSAPVFRSDPVREFEGHTNDVLALSWSKNNFLLSCSIDKTVRLWHMSRADCLCVYKHSDLVTSICFHPTDDRFFLAGSLDAQLRLWSIPDKNVAFSVPTPEFITAVGFAPDGKTAICGLLNGLCTFFETDGLKTLYSIHVRSSRGKNAKGSKITGIRTALVPPGSEKGQVKVLITSNDSRVRVYNLKTRMLEVKFKGLENQSSQINARFSEDGQFVICGSEDRKAYIWGLDHPEAELKEKQVYECFDAHPEVVTTALMAPVKTRQLLSGSGDPIYDLCNPPPVTLRSLDEASPSQTGLSDADGAGKRDSVHSSTKKPEESPAYIKRSRHMDGNIIVTTDRTGTIKVFRQDCAFAKRQQNLWETGSRFSGKMAKSLGRSGSVMTKASGSSRVQSRRGSLNLAANPQFASDRIMSWRQDIEGGRASFGGGTPTRSERSLSPSKMSRTPLNTSAANLASEARKHQYASSPTHPRPPSLNSPAASTRRASVRVAKEKEQGLTQPPTPSFSLISSTDSSEQQVDKADSGFWSFGRWKGGIPGLRLSTPSSSPPAAAPTEPPPPSTGASTGDTLAPGDRRAMRRSMGAGDLRRLRNADADRRKSVGVMPVLRSSPLVSRADSIDELAESPLETSSQSSKMRTDSGVGRLSAESSDEGMTCQSCGSQQFKIKKTHDDQTSMTCVKCGKGAAP